MTRKDPAVLFFGSDFYEDEHVLQMTLEQQGAYWRLLWLSWRNEGLPADPEALARMLRVAPKVFAARIWPAIAPCWDEVGGRLVQKRQEEERERRAAAKGTEEVGAPAVDGRSERMRQLAQRRWGKRGGDADAATHADADAPRNADAHAQRNAGRNAVPHLPPAPPSVPSEAKYPNTRNAGPHASAHAEGANAAHAQSPEPEPPLPVIQLQLALLKTAYRSKLPAFDRSRELTRRAAELLATGLSPFDVSDLAELDREKATKEPGSLLAHWLDENLWREVLDEQRMKAKERALRGRAPTGDAMAGVYGE